VYDAFAWELRDIIVVNRRAVVMVSLSKPPFRKFRTSGQQMAEFSAALVLLIVGIGIPLIDLGVLPFRWLLWQQLLTADVRKLAQSEKFSTAMTALDSNTALSVGLGTKAGVKLISSQCAIIITMLNEPRDVFIAEKPGAIEGAWLPGGAKSPCSYELEVTSVIALSPLILLNGIKSPIPGLTEPIICTTKARAHWENYGRDPYTKQFFMNE
jgi:hypothetical protein